METPKSYKVVEIKELSQVVHNLKKHLNILLLLAAFTSVSCNSSKAKSDSKSNHVEQSTEKEELKPITEINIGYFRLFLEQSNQLTTKEQNEFFNKLKSAHKTLVETLGEESLAYYEGHHNVPMRIKTLNNANAMVTWDFLQRINESTGFKSVLLSIDGVSVEFDKKSNESTLFHELIHLLVQGAEFYTSKAFLEGHAHLLEETVYPEDADEKTINQLLENPHISEALNIGLDFNMVDEFKEGGITNSNLKKIAHKKMKNFWKKVVEQDPAFMKNFYAEVNKQKSQGKKSFSKEDFVAISILVSSSFKELYQNEGEVLKFLGEDAASPVVKAIVDKNSNSLIIFNFQTIPQNVSGNTIYFRRTDLALPGEEMQVTIAGKTFSLKNSQCTFLNVTDVAIPAGAGQIQVSINGQEIPLVF